MLTHIARRSAGRPAAPVRRNGGKGATRGPRAPRFKSTDSMDEADAVLKLKIAFKVNTRTPEGLEWVEKAETVGSGREAGAKSRHAFSLAPVRPRPRP